MMSEMIFVNESDFEDHLREIIDSSITSKNPCIYTLENKAIGDIVIMRDGPSSAIFFLEVKYYQSANNRLGFGARRGTGIQPEILRRRPAYLESHFRWVLGSDTHSGDGYWFVTSEEIRQFTVGGYIGSKQNNIQEKLFRECPSIDEDRLVKQLKIWLSV